MKYCSHCGTQLSDDASFCSQCGQPVAPQVSAQPQQQYAASAQAAKQEDNELMKTIITILLILSCVVEGICTLGIALAWCIPITIKVRSRMKAGVPTGTGLNVCTLLFVNTIAGILLFCLNDEIK